MFPLAFLKTCDSVARGLMGDGGTRDHMPADELGEIEPRHLSKTELAQVFTPDPDDIQFATQAFRDPATQMGQGSLLRIAFLLLGLLHHETLKPAAAAPPAERP